MLTQHITKLDRCWVCQTPFNHSVKCEEHHVIPRAYGGIDGPQVSLCDSHHTAAHQIADALWAKKNHFRYLTGDTQKDVKLLFLASRIYNARLLVHKDPNKRRILVLNPSNAFTLKLDKLKTVYGSRIGRERIIELAVERLYKQHFID